MKNTSEEFPTVIPSMDLNLGDEDDHPRRVVCAGGSILAYGGDEGTISLVDFGNKEKCKLVRQFEDPIRAVAISEDTKRICVGFEDGATTIFCYEESDEWSVKDGLSKDKHPFFGKKSNDEDDLELFTQSESLYTTANFEESSLETSFPGPRFSVPIRDLKFHPGYAKSKKNEYFLSVASESSPGLCIMNVTSASELESCGRILETGAGIHHDGSGIRGISFSKTGDFLASLSMDGRLCTWTTDASDTPEVDWDLNHRDSHFCVPKKDQGELGGNDIFDVSCRPLWSPDGTFLALPGSTDVQLRHKSKLEKEVFLLETKNGHKDTIVAMAWIQHKGENILVTSGRDQRILLWHVFNNAEDDSPGRFLAEISSSTPTPSIPTELMWREEKDALLILTGNGRLSAVSTKHIKLDEGTNKKQKNEDLDVEQTMTKGVTTGSSNTRIKSKKLMDNDSDDETDGLFKNDVKVSRPATTSKFINEEADEEDDGDDQDPLIAQESVVSNDDLSLTDNIGDFLVNEPETPKTFSKPIQSASLPQAQPPFAPSSTPLEDSSQRILCWNHVGVITHRDSSHDEFDKSENAVDITFVNNFAQRRGISFPESMGFILGSLGEEGAIFASDMVQDDEEEDEDNPIEGNFHELDDMNQLTESTKKKIRQARKSEKTGTKESVMGSRIFFYRFETFGPAKDKNWNISLPTGERVLGCACGEGWAAVATSTNLVRIFSSSGLQTYMFCLEGDPVTIVGRGRFLCMIYHRTSPDPVSGTQRLGYTLMNVTTKETLTTGPLSSVSAPGSGLAWVGIGEDLCVYTMDTSGRMCILVPLSNNSWQFVPVLDTKYHTKNSSDFFWPVTVLEGKLICIPLKGGREHPDPVRRPVTTSLMLQLPLGRSSTVGNGYATKLEELGMRGSLALGQKEFLHNLGGTDAEENGDSKNEFHKYLTNIDKVTLKLFFESIKRNKVELALDLCERLHREQSLVIALKAADQYNRIRLCEEIEYMKERRFPTVEFSDEEEETSVGYGYNGRATDNDEESGVSDTSSTKEEIMSKSTPMSQDPAPSQATTSHKRKKNPFAKKTMESPAKKAPERNKKQKLGLSRHSTISTQARLNFTSSKHIM